MFGRERNTNATRRLKYDIENNTQYNRLKIIKYDHYKKIGYTFKDYVVCDCSCGNKNIVKEYQGILSGMIKSCGCLNNETRIIVGKNNKRYNIYDLTGEYGIGYTSKGEEFWFDLEDYDKIKDYCWHVNQYCGYLEGQSYGITYKFHREIMGLSKEDKSVFVDHINHNKLDNRKENLRLCSNSENCKNRNIAKNNKSGVTGVTWSKQMNKWKANIGVDNKLIHLGFFSDKEKAIEARKEAELLYYKEFRNKLS